MAEWLAHQTPSHKIVGSSPAKASRLIKNCPTWATDGDNGASVHSAVNEYLAIDNDRQRWQLYLDYPWRIEAFKRVYTPPGSWAGDGGNRFARDNNM